MARYYYLPRGPAILVVTPQQRSKVRAYIDDSSIQAQDDILLTAVSSEKIEAEVLAGSAAIAGGGKAGVGLSGSGVSATNKIATDVQAYIDGDGATGISADRLTLTATDSSSIDAVAGAASLAASFGGTAGVSLSIGVALARNVISNDVAAYIDNADFGVTTNVGDITLGATADGSIKVLSVAASLAAGFGGTAGVALSGAGAESTNIIRNHINAFVEDSILASAGAVDVDAMNTATIDATVELKSRGDINRRLLR